MAKETGCDGESGAGADLWAAVVAEVLGFEHDEALTLGRAVEGLNANPRVSMGLSQPTPTEVKEHRWEMRKEETVTIDLLYRGAVPAKYTDEGLRALGGNNPIRPECAQKYPGGKAR